MMALQLAPRRSNACHARATVWAGVDRRLRRARRGLHESPKLTKAAAADVGELGRRGIEVARDLRRDDARAVLAAYGQTGGRRY